MVKKTWSVPDAFSSGFVLLALGLFFGICGFSLRREISRIDADRASLVADLKSLDARTVNQNDRLIRVEESFRFISAELARIGANVDRSNQKLDKALAENR